MKLLKDKVVVVTGGCGLLGMEFVKGILRNGGICIISDIQDACGLNSKLCLNDEIVYNFEFTNLDINSKESIIAVIDRINKKYGRIDALVNNAYPRNKNYGRHFFEVEYKDFCENVNLHLGGYFLMCQQFANYFKSQGCGNIINIASIYGVIPPKFEVYNNTNMTMPVEYAAIKSGIIHLTKYVAKYLKSSGVRVNAISPGGVLDNQPDTFIKEYNKICSSKGLLDKTDIVGTLLFLLSDDSKFINGQNIIVDDGFSL